MLNSIKFLFTFQLTSRRRLLNSILAALKREKLTSFFTKKTVKLYKIEANQTH